MTNSIVTALISFFVTVAIAPFAIKYLIKLKFGQEIREIGPEWHSKKRGTPTMGGVVFILAVLIATAVNYKLFSPKLLLMLVGSVAFGIIGFIDDYIKVVLKRNLGLTAKQKSFLQVLVAAVVLVIGLNYGIISTKIFIPFFRFYADLGWFYIPLALFVMVGVVNSVNLTDGIDGLATSVTIVVMIFFGCILVDQPSLSVFVNAVLGGLIGFLLFNKNPAKVFMGDTGSLFLGGAVALMSIICENPLILILVGFVYFAETLSVIIQVTSFKLTGKRVFKMTPIHHHFEMCGWKEKKIVLVFSAATAILVIISLFGVL